MINIKNQQGNVYCGYCGSHWDTMTEMKITKIFTCATQSLFGDVIFIHVKNNTSVTDLYFSKISVKSALVSFSKFGRVK